MESKTSILIAEDEFMLTMLFEHILNQNGYEDLHFVKTGDDAIKKARELDPSLILMDIFLEGSMDGIDAVRKIRDFSMAPVIYVTGNSDYLTNSRAMDTGPSSYIVKPIDPEDLMELIRENLQSEK